MIIQNRYNVNFHKKIIYIKIATQKLYWNNEIILFEYSLRYYNKVLLKNKALMTYILIIIYAEISVIEVKKSIRN